jgi:GT2 family glycosyltransferase
VDTELVVVDDGSSDGSSAFVYGLNSAASNIQGISLPLNSGLSASRNLAISKSKGEYILFLDNDTVFLGDVIKIMRSKLVEHSSSICGMCGILPFDFSNFLHIHANDITDDLIVEAVPGYCMMVDRKVIDDGVVFDEELAPFGAEDIDFCFHARSKGHTVLAGTNIPLKHFEHGSQMSLRPEYREWMDKSHTRVKQKWQKKLPMNSTEKILGMLHDRDQIILTTETEHCKFFDLTRGKPH